MSHTAKFLQFLLRAIEFDRVHGTYRTRCARIQLKARARVLADRLIQGRA